MIRVGKSTRLKWVKYGKEINIARSTSPQKNIACQPVKFGKDLTRPLVSKECVEKNGIEKSTHKGP